MSIVTVRARRVRTGPSLMLDTVRFERGRLSTTRTRIRRSEESIRNRSFVPERLNARSTGGRLRGLTGAGSGAAWPTRVPPPAVGILAPPLAAALAEGASTKARTRAAAGAERRMPSDTVGVLLLAFKRRTRTCASFKDRSRRARTPGCAPAPSLTTTRSLADARIDSARGRRPARSWNAPDARSRRDRPYAVSMRVSSSRAPFLASGSFRFPHFGDCTHEGQPFSHGHSAISRMASRTSPSKRS